MLDYVVKPSKIKIPALSNIQTQMLSFSLTKNGQNYWNGLGTISQFCSTRDLQQISFNLIKIAIFKDILALKALEMKKYSWIWAPHTHPRRAADEAFSQIPKPLPTDAVSRTRSELRHFYLHAMVISWIWVRITKNFNFD